ncbi:MAG: hypothetical protein KF858_06455 [Candidatus Sumerlaeia bacterium]|nr:hypothetical protein [Candidatus Sumerlaeia bacterium]
MMRTLWRWAMLAAILAWVTAGVASAQQVVFEERFEGAEGTRPAGWRITAQPPTWSIASGRLDSGDGARTAELSWAAVDRPGAAEWSNVRVGSDFWMLRDLGWVALAVRYADAENHYAAVLRTFRRPGEPRILAQVEILRVTNGVAATLATAIEPDSLNVPVFHSMTPAATPRRLEFAAEGSALTVRLDGRQILSATDTGLARGTVAVGQAFNRVLFDNVRVEALGGAAVAAATTPTATPAAGATAPRADSFRLVLLNRIPDREAVDDLARELTGRPDLDTIDHGDGTYSLLVGRYGSRPDAERARDGLVAGGFIVLDIIQGDMPRQLVGQPTPGMAPTPAGSVDPEFQAMLEAIRQRQQGGQATPAPITTPAATPPPTPAQPTADSPQAVALRQAAVDSETQGDLRQALIHWQSLRAILPEGASFNEATDKIRSINERLRQQEAEAVTARSGLQPIVLIAIVAGIVLILGGIVFVVMRSRKKNDELRQKVEALAKAPVAPTAASITKPAKAKPAEKPADKPAGVDVKEVDSSARIRPGTVMPAKPVTPKPEPVPKAVQKAAAAPAPAPAAPPPPAPAPPPLPPEPMPDPGSPESGIRLDFLFDTPAEENVETRPDSDAEDITAQAADGPKKQPSTQFIIPPMPDVAPGQAPPAAVTPLPLPAPPDPSNKDLFYEQDFDNEEVGGKPANWRGDYEYATLTVVEHPDDPSRRCMRFEKRNGVGSAYYSCRFPNANGRIVVEFDIRCDEKNKYLLGFYIEQDEDFRQSIHTIVHRTNSSANPTLRIQNEATPYEFGKWTHIRFEIDLPRHLIDGHANEKVIVSGARLNSCPKSINTLSIRDNLATTGVLLIDNIKIYRAR